MNTKKVEFPTLRHYLYIWGGAKGVGEGLRVEKKFRLRGWDKKV